MNYRVLGRTLTRQALGGPRGLHFADRVTDPVTGCSRTDRQRERTRTTVTQVGPRDLDR